MPDAAVEAFAGQAAASAGERPKWSLASGENCWYHVFFTGIGLGPLIPAVLLRQAFDPVISRLASPSRRLHYSAGMTLTGDMAGAVIAPPERIWEPAYDADGQARPGAWAAELTSLLDRHRADRRWPAGAARPAGAGRHRRARHRP
jgi:hypothetical protein